MKERPGSQASAQIVGCSTAGEITGVCVRDDSIAVTAAAFTHTRVRVEEVNLATADQSSSCGEKLAKALLADDLVHVLVFSDGLHVNGDELVRGLAGALPKHVAITGGLSGDGAGFKQTLVLFNGTAADHRIVAVGFYGNRLRVGYGSMGGWVVRTILGSDEKHQSLTFAADIPKGAHARLMRANFERLIEGASVAARATQQAFGSNHAQLALLISCVGRRLVLAQRIEEEVEAARAVLGDQPALAGFYSYGEISFFTKSAPCQLHNQTMTITAFTEDE